MSQEPTRTTTRAAWLAIAIAVLAGFAVFNPLSRWVLHASQASFAPKPYSAIYLADSGVARTGVVIGTPVSVYVQNATSGSLTYQWQASQGNSAVASGAISVAADSTSPLMVPTTHDVAGPLTVALVGTQNFINVPLVRSPASSGSSTLKNFGHHKKGAK